MRYKEANASRPHGQQSSGNFKDKTKSIRLFSKPRVVFFLLNQADYCTDVYNMGYCLVVGRLCLLGDDACLKSVYCLFNCKDEGNARSTSATDWSRMDLRVLGLSSSFSILAMMDSASSRCCLCLTWPS